VETLLDLQSKLALYGWIASLKVDNICNSKCNCLFVVWMDIKANLLFRIKSSLLRGSEMQCKPEQELSSTFKSSAAFGGVVADLRALSKDFTKKDYVIIVAGPGSSLKRDLSY
jgi:hypothetical protein